MARIACTNGEDDPKRGNMRQAGETAQSNDHP